MARIAVAVGLALIVAGAWYISQLQGDVARLEARLDSALEAKEAPAPEAAEEAPAQKPSGRQLTALQREAMIATLGGTGMSSTNPVWFATVTNNSEAAAFRRAIAGVFEEAGWQVQGNSAVRFPMKPGVYLFAAEEEPPDYVAQAEEALLAGGIELTGTGSGYRAFYEDKKKEDPSWVGLDMGPDATYLIVVGRKPPEDPAT